MSHDQKTPAFVSQERTLDSPQKSDHQAPEEPSRVQENRARRSEIESFLEQNQVATGYHHPQIRNQESVYFRTSDDRQLHGPVPVDHLPTVPEEQSYGRKPPVPVCNRAARSARDVHSSL